MKYRILFFLSFIISMGFCACTDDSDDIFINENQISTRAVNGAYTYPDVSEILKQDVVNLKSATIIQYTIKGRFMSR